MNSKSAVTLLSAASMSSTAPWAPEPSTAQASDISMAIRATVCTSAVNSDLKADVPSLSVLPPPPTPSTGKTATALPESPASFPIPLPMLTNIWLSVHIWFPLIPTASRLNKSTPPAIAVPFREKSIAVVMRIHPSLHTHQADRKTHTRSERTRPAGHPPTPPPPRRSPRNGDHHPLTRPEKGHSRKAHRERSTRQTPTPPRKTPTRKAPTTTTGLMNPTPHHPRDHGRPRAGDSPPLCLQASSRTRRSQPCGVME